MGDQDQRFAAILNMQQREINDLKGTAKVTEDRIGSLTMLAIILLVQLHDKECRTTGGPYYCTNPGCLDALRVINGE